jgi:hypothetical protein
MSRKHTIRHVLKSVNKSGVLLKEKKKPISAVHMIKRERKPNALQIV